MSCENICQNAKYLCVYALCTCRSLTLVQSYRKSFEYFLKLNILNSHNIQTFHCMTMKKTLQFHSVRQQKHKYDSINAILYLKNPILWICAYTRVQFLSKHKFRNGVHEYMCVYVKKDEMGFPIIASNTILGVVVVMHWFFDLMDLKLWKRVQNWIEYKKFSFRWVFC